MLTPNFRNQIQNETTGTDGSVPVNQPMSDEQFNQWVNSTPTEAKRSPYQDAMGMNDKTPGIIPQAYSQFSKGFEQTKAGVNNPNLGAGLVDIGKGILNEAAGGIRAVFSPLEAVTKIVSQLPGIRHVVGGAEGATNWIGDQISNYKPLQDFMQKNPDAPEVASNLITVLTPILLTKYIEMRGGLGSVKEDVKTSVTDWNRGIESGDIPMDKVYKNSSGVFQEGAETHVISDMVGKMNEKVPGLGDAFGKIVNKVEQTPTSLLQQAENFISKHEYSGLGSIGSLVKKDLGGAASKISDIAGEVTGKIKGVLPKAGEAAPVVLDEVKVTDLYNRAIRPTVQGKASAADIVKGNTNALTGLKNIADNKANLSFTDANGEVITGKSPQSVDQLGQAIDQTKKNIFDQYHALAIKAGEAEITIKPSNVAAELDTVISNKTLAISNPESIKYAKSLQKRLTASGELSPIEAENLIKNYNEKLKAWYKNPNPDTISELQIDAMVANKFRAELDNTISGLTGENYQALKNQYGALSSMEKDVAHRNIVWGRQNKVGLIANLANITAGAELVRGLITMSPVDIAASLTIKGMQKYLQYLNNPDVGISRLFNEIDAASRPATGSTISPNQEIPVSNSPSDITIPPAESQIPKGEGEIPETTVLTKKAMTELKTSGGSTLNDLGESPIDGYTYSPNKSTETKIPAKQFSEKNYNDFHDKYEKELQQPGNYLGIYKDGDDIVLDISRNTSNIREAITGAKTGNQDSIYDVKYGKLIIKDQYETTHRNNKSPWENQKTNLGGNSSTTKEKRSLKKVKKSQT